MGRSSVKRSRAKLLPQLAQRVLLTWPVKDEAGQSYEVKAADLTDAFVKVYASYTLDEADLKNSSEFKNDGRFDRAFYKDTFFEENGTRLPFFYELMVTTKGRSGTTIEKLGSGSTAVSDAFSFAQTINNLLTLIFQRRRA